MEVKTQKIAAIEESETEESLKSAAASDDNVRIEQDPVIQIHDLEIRYGKVRAVHGVSMPIRSHKVTGIIGPSGCGKSSVLRTINRMNDLIAGAQISGKVLYRGADIYGPKVDAVEVRRRIGMVFQKANPFPKSIADNVSYGLKVIGTPKKEFPEIVERSLRSAALWDEVKDRLNDSALSLSGGQQQRLCIARSIATNPDVLLMDEPCSALDPIATAHIEELIAELKKDYSIVIVTHNMQQARRVSDYCAFFTAEQNADDTRTGLLVEYDETDFLFTTPKDQRTADYVEGKFG